MKLTTDQLLLIAEMLREKRTAKEIAAVIGCSKSALIGMVWRHPDLHAIGFTKKPFGSDEVRTRIRREVRARLFARSGMTDAFGHVLIKDRAKPLEKLNSTHCRFPLWPNDSRPDPDRMLFCGEAKLPDSSYCQIHRNICAGTARGIAGLGGRHRR